MLPLSTVIERDFDSSILIGRNFLLPCFIYTYVWTGFCFLGAVTFEQLERDHEIQVRAEPKFLNLLKVPSGQIGSS
jgi:hypothetical protein